MHVTLGGFVLFLHIGVAIVAFMIAAVLHGALHQLARARTVAQMRLCADLVHRLEPLLPILALLLFGLGAWLIHLSGGEFGWGDGWIATAIVALVVIEGLAGAALAPRTKRLVEAIKQTPEGEVPAAVHAQAVDPVIWDIAHVATLGFLGVVFVMAAKPGGGFAAGIVVLAALIGIGLSRWQLAVAARLADGAVPAQRSAGAEPVPTTPVE